MDLTLLKDLQSSLRNSTLSSSSLGSRLDLNEEEEIRDLIIKLESMESMQDSLALSSTMLDAIGNAPPETLQALRSFHSDHDFEKERVEYERLKLEEQITMLEKVIEDGIRQTNELQEIHHHEVEDLHSQILNLQKQVAAHVRFIDEHCAESDDMRCEMQNEIDRLVTELEGQTRTNRTTESLQSQVTRLETEMIDIHSKLRSAEEGQKRAEALLAARMEEKDKEVGDLHDQIKWFRTEYDSLLEKLEDMETVLNDRRDELRLSKRELFENEEKLKELEMNNSSLQFQLEQQDKYDKEQIDQLKINLNDEKSISLKQRNELEQYKTELQKAKEIITRLKEKDEEILSKLKNAPKKENVRFSNDTALRERVRMLEMKIERKEAAFDDLKRENMRLRDVSEKRRRRERFWDRKEKGSDGSGLFPSISMQDLSKASGKSPGQSPGCSKKSDHHHHHWLDQHDDSASLSDESGIASSLRSFSRSLQCSTSLLSLDQSDQLEHFSNQRGVVYRVGRSPTTHHQIRRCESMRSLPTFETGYQNLSPKQFHQENIKKSPKSTSTPKRPREIKRIQFSSDSEEVEKVVYVPQKSAQLKSIGIQTTKVATCSTRIQTTPSTSSVRCQANVIEKSPPTQKSPTRSVMTRSQSHRHLNFDDFKTEHYMPAQRIREITHQRSALRETLKDDQISRLTTKLDEKRSEIRVLRQQMREKDEALARNSSQLGHLRAENDKMFTDRSFGSRLPNLHQSNTTLDSVQSGDDADVEINLRDGDDEESYGQISQVRPGQIQELKTVRRTVKNLNGLPVKYSTKVSVKCQKVAVFF